jgi:hypothetical protein
MKTETSLEGPYVTNQGRTLAQYPEREDEAAKQLEGIWRGHMHVLNKLSEHDATLENPAVVGIIRPIFQAFLEEILAISNVRVEKVLVSIDMKPKAHPSVTTYSSSLYGRYMSLFVDGEKRNWTPAYRRFWERYYAVVGGIVPAEVVFLEKNGKAAVCKWIDTIGDPDGPYDPYFGYLIHLRHEAAVMNHARK